jgi:hypothetical protein
VKLIPRVQSSQKRRQEEERMIEKVSSSLKENINPARDNGSSSHVLASALEQYISLIAKTVESLQDR